MSKQTKVILVLVILCILGIGLYWRGASSPARGQSQEYVDPLTKLARINSKARELRKARERNAPGSEIAGLAGELTDAVSSEFGYGSERFEQSDSVADMFTRPDVDAIKGRLARAETAYQQGKKSGIPEISVVRVVNGLAKKFGAPEYAATDKREVRRLRATMLVNQYDFVTKDKLKDDKLGKTKGGSISSVMSPVEAAYTTATLLLQKVTNQEYQLTSEEKRARWFEKHTGKRFPNLPQADQIAPQTQKQKEMAGIVARGLSKLSLTDQRDLLNESLDSLGIPR